MSYAGDLTVAEAVEKLRGGAVLVDVRTETEWQQVGVPVTNDDGAPARFIEWNRIDGNRNTGFLNELQSLRGKELLLICRSGRRSIDAAISATAAGHTAYNVLGGFEAAGGWQQSDLPWKRD
jgi:rhodanese-related sulfurtransferase